MKRQILILVVLFLSSVMYADDLCGFWQSVDQKTRLPSSVIAVYDYQGKYYGKIVATCNKQGVITETIYQPKTRATGIAGNPYYCGIDIIWACTADGGGIFKGHVVDPKEGKRYTAKIWKEHGNLILRGELLMFGRNETLVQMPQSSSSQYFGQLDLTTFTPAPYKLK